MGYNKDKYKNSNWTVYRNETLLEGPEGEEVPVVYFYAKNGVTGEEFGSLTEGDTGDDADAFNSYLASDPGAGTDVFNSNAPIRLTDVLTLDTQLVFTSTTAPATPSAGKCTAGTSPTGWSRPGTRSPARTGS